MSQDPYENDPDYLATDLESKYPPPEFPPHSSSRFHPYAPQRPEPQKEVPQTAVPQRAVPQLKVDKQVPHTQTIGWISKKFEELAKDDLNIKIGKLSLPDYNQFSMEELVEKLMVERLKVSRIPKDLYMIARAQSNPYELIYKSQFNHSDAIKLANLDKLACFLTDESFSFLTIGKSSGFAEYLFFRRPAARGYGVNLPKTAFDGKNFISVADLNDWKGVSNLYKEILQNNASGVDFVSAMTDMIDLSGDEYNGEYHCKRILILQLYGMFSVLKVGGDFLLRMFDLNTTFSIDVLYILYRYFSKIAICKPYSSRACENERFIICKGLQKMAPDNILKHLFETSNSFGQDSGSKVISFKDQVRSSVSDVLSILRPDRISKDEDFMDSIQGSNMKLVIKEREALEDLLRYAGKSMKLGYDQSKIKDLCFNEWQIDG